MTLIPLISSALFPRRAATAPTGADMLMRGSYDPGAGHRPFAASVAIGLPLALVVAVALSPMIVDKEPVITEQTWKSFRTPPPPPPPDADPAPQPKQQQTPVTIVRSPLPPLTQDPPFFAPPETYIPPSGTGTGTGPVVVADPPVVAPPPKLVLAQLDQRYLAGFQPDYPPREQHGGIEGVAKVRVLIGTDGRVKQVDLVSTDSPGFFDVTKRRALAKWRFKPATRGGVAEESWKEMTVRFEIKNA